MDKKTEQLKFLIDCGIIAVIRLAKADLGLLIKITEAIKSGGVNCIEITMTTPGALEAIQEISRKFRKEVLFGVGSVLDPKTARSAILAGAEFVVAPTLNKEVIKLCKRYKKIVIPGAFTPTEILSAWELGADIVKVFPATALGPQYFKDIKGPLPQIKLLPTGGVNLDNAGEFIKAGAVAIAVGGNLIDKKAVREGNFEILTETANKFVQTIKSARTEKCT